jgi:ABC-2 type transport system permease protein
MFTHWARLLRLTARRDRSNATIWTIALAGLAAAIAAYYPALFPDQASLQAMATTMNTPAMTSLMGPVYGLGHLSISIVMAQECLIWFLLASAIMNILLVTRYTRADEESGRTETLLGLPVGRLSVPASVFAWAVVLNLMIGLLTALGLLGVNLPGTTPAGAFSYGAVLAACGLAFAGITALLAQLFSSSGATLASSFVVLLAAFVVRAAGDMNGADYAVVSPFGLALRVFPFDANRFWPSAVLLIQAVVFAAVAMWVCALRDQGSGIIPARPGRIHATGMLRTPLGLAWRCGRGMLAGWAAGMVVIGLVYGAVVPNLQDLLSRGGTMGALVTMDAGASMVDNYIALISMICALIASVPLMLTVLRLRSEETKGRTDQLLALPVSRVRLLGSQLLLAFLASLVLPGLSALGLWLGAGSARSGIEAVFGACYVYLPAMWVMIGVAAILVGLLPKVTGLAWAVFGYSFLAMYLGRLAHLPAAATRVSPFGNIPTLPIEAFSWWPMIVLSLIAVLLCTAGLAGYRRRDM